MKVYVGMQWNQGIIITKGHQLNTWHVKKMQTKNGMKSHEA
jgi:hypothetical protein